MNNSVTNEIAKSPDNPEKRVAQISHTEIHSGPLPRPDVLKCYNNIVPGAAERIIKMAENQAEHRQKLEEKVIYSGALDARMGLIFAFILGVIVVAVSYKLINNNHTVTGTIFGGVYLVSIVTAFITGSKQQKEERRERRKESEEK